MNHSLDSNVFHNVADIKWNVTTLSAEVIDSTFGSVKGVSDLVSDQHIVDILALVFPHGQTKDTILNIKHCCLHATVSHSDVLFGEKTGEGGL